MSIASADACAACKGVRGASRVHARDLHRRYDDALTAFAARAAQAKAETQLAQVLDLVSRK